jgi:hypothetical protein
MGNDMPVRSGFRLPDEKKGNTLAVLLYVLVYSDAKFLDRGLGNREMLKNRTRGILSKLLCDAAGSCTVHSITDADFTWIQTACPGSRESAARERFVTRDSNFDVVGLGKKEAFLACGSMQRSRMGRQRRFGR